MKGVRMRKIIPMVFVGLLLFGSELFAENNVASTSKIVYGSEKEDSIIRQKEINLLIEK
jgi:hypothetical protein